MQVAHDRIPRADEQTQDGRPAGVRTAVGFDDAGWLRGRSTNGSDLTSGQIAVALFENPRGLARVSPALFAPTYESGPATWGRPGAPPLPLVQLGAVELPCIE
jgi:flagellar hook protein FlgE